MNLLAIQISGKLINLNPDPYLDKIYSDFKIFGYYRNKHFLELPLWIAELSGLLEHLKIKIIELGIESYNNPVLRQVNKPQTVQSIKKCIDFLKHKEVKIILNIMIGLPKENKQTYNKTLKFLDNYKKSLFFLNIYNIALYNNTVLANEIKSKNAKDSNEFVINKSFHTSKENINAVEFSNKLYKLAYEVITYNSIRV